MLTNLVSSDRGGSSHVACMSNWFFRLFLSLSSTTREAKEREPGIEVEKYPLFLDDRGRDRDVRRNIARTKSLSLAQVKH